MGSIAQYVIYCATPQFIFYTPNMLQKIFIKLLVVINQPQIF